MVKEEVTKIINELRILTSNYEKFKDYVNVFTSEPRCKKGVLEFMDNIFSYGDEENKAYPAVFGVERNELALKLTTAKSELNVQLFKQSLHKLNLESGAVNELLNTRRELIQSICEYVKHIQTELDKSQLSDARERQVYLRRALARLKTVMVNPLTVAISKDGWSEVTPCDWVKYLTDSMDEILSQHFSNATPEPWMVNYDHYGLESSLMIDSIESYLDYLDTFLKY